MENTLDAKATLRHLRGSARKARLVLDMIRGRRVKEASNILQFSTKKVAKDIHKLLKSAVANAIQVAGKTDTDSMIVDKAWADNGPIMYRQMLRARGSAGRIRKRFCHITIGITNSK